MELPKVTAGLGYVKVTQPVAVNSHNANDGVEVVKHAHRRENKQRNKLGGSVMHSSSSLLQR